ncbi:MAG: HepT-like ribonuclease domain-containing protein [Bacteroidota bacterium]|nr:HepT-like ribonuclease domain-containing protein [Bacteroidota bacterium]
MKKKIVPDELRIKYPLVEWKKMAGIRDKIIHDYLGVDYEVVWKTIEDKIPSLQEWMEIIIEKEAN